MGVYLTGYRPHGQIAWGTISPVNLSPKSHNLDKIATETLFVGNASHTHPEQHIKNIEQSKYAKVVNLHNLKMAT